MIFIQEDKVMPMDNFTTTKELNTVLKGEQMAAESYDLFISNVDDERIKDQFELFRSNHKKNAEILSDRIRSLGAEPDKGTGLPGMFSQMKLEFQTIGKDSDDVLKRAYFGEDKGVKMAEEIIKGDLDSESASIVNEVLNNDRHHLEMMMDILQNNHQH
jgi:bacterioferritin (cytochrome b1)